MAAKEVGATIDITRSPSHRKWDVLSGSIGGDDGIGGVGGGSAAATSSEMQQTIGTWHRDNYDKGMMLSIAAQ